MLYSRYSERAPQEVNVADRILVVEDEASVADVLRLYLNRAGFEVSVVLDGKKAIEKTIGDAIAIFGYSK
jgi:CheY-like chemotaxis protein